MLAKEAWRVVKREIDWPGSAGVAAEFSITLRTSAGIPPQLKRLHGKYGLPPLPRVDVCPHAGGDPESPASKQLRRTVTEHALTELPGNKKRRVRTN